MQRWKFNTGENMLLNTTKIYIWNNDHIKISRYYAMWYHKPVLRNYSLNDSSNERKAQNLISTQLKKIGKTFLGNGIQI